MKRLYQQTFDRIHMPEKRAEMLRETLISQCSDPETEVYPMKKLRPKPMSLVAAIVMVCALTVTAFAYGGEVVTKVYQFMTGGISISSVDEDGNHYTISGGAEDQVTAPVQLRKDGRLYLVIHGENRDITDECSYTEPYIYTCTGEDGLRHAFVIGGDLDAIGWSEFIWDENGTPTVGNAVFGTPDGSDDAPWLDAGMAELDLPWAAH